MRIQSIIQHHQRRVRVLFKELSAIPDLRQWEPQMSYLHMSCNRIFRFAPNEHEALVYELSRRSLYSEIVRN